MLSICHLASECFTLNILTPRPEGESVFECGYEMGCFYHNNHTQPQGGGVGGDDDDDNIKVTR